MTKPLCVGFPAHSEPYSQTSGATVLVLAGKGRATHLKAEPFLEVPLKRLRVLARPVPVDQVVAGGHEIKSPPQKIELSISMNSPAHHRADARQNCPLERWI